MKRERGSILWDVFNRTKPSLAETLARELLSLFDRKVEDPIIERFPRSADEGFRCKIALMYYGMVQAFQVAAAHDGLAAGDIDLVGAVTQANRYLLQNLARRIPAIRIAKLVVNPAEELDLPESLRTRHGIQLSAQSFDSDSLPADILLEALLPLRLRAAVEDFDYAVSQSTDPDERLKLCYLKQADTFITNVRGFEAVDPNFASVMERQTDLFLVSTFLETVEREIVDLLRRA